MKWQGEDLQAWRNRLGLSQADAARTLGYKNRSAICRYERGHAQVPDRLQYLCIAMEENVALKAKS